MKKITVLSTLVILILLTACKSTTNQASIFGTNWELEYLSGPGDDVVSEFFKDKKPQLYFNQETMKAEGHSGCNGYSAEITVKGKSISFGEPEPTTMMYCGEGEAFFLGILKRINKYRLDDEGKLSLMVGDVPFLRFKKMAE